MINAIKMDLYKMFKSKSTWILLFCIIAVSFATVGVMKITINQFKDNPALLEQIEQASSDENVSIGFTAKTDNITDHINGMKFTVNELFSSMTNGSMISMLVAIFCLIFFNSELKSGYIKNLAGQFTRRRYLIFSKLVVAFLFTIFTFAFSISAMILGSKVFLGYVISGGMSSLIKIVLTQFILMFAICALILFIVEWLRNTAGSITASMCIVAGIADVLVMFLSKLLTGNNIIKDKDFTLSKYILTGNISTIGSASSSKDMITAVIVAGVFLILSIVGSVFVLEKRDIK